MAGSLAKKRDALFDRHIQHVVDRLAAHRHIQRLAVEARALARAAGHLHIGHEVELRGDHAFALALLAAAALHVEAEAARLVPRSTASGACVKRSRMLS